MLCAAADPTSKTNANLQKILKRYPAADANKDGILTLPEAKAFQKLRREREANRPVLKPTQTDIAYGTHARHKLDLWLYGTRLPHAAAHLHPRRRLSRWGQKQLSAAGKLD